MSKTKTFKSYYDKKNKRLILEFSKKCDTSTIFCFDFGKKVIVEKPEVIPVKKDKNLKMI